MTISTMRPGLLVGLKTSIRGNVTYQTRDIEAEHNVGADETRARWETERTVKNKAELARAVKARGEARHAIASVCSRTSFGLLCPNAWEDDLRTGIAKARAIADEFNKGSRVTELSIYVIVGRVAQDDVEAVRAINSEVRDLMREMAAGIKELDVKKVRDAANRARSVGAMLTPEAADRVKVAIDAARMSARKIIKAGEEAGQAIDKEAIKKINQARTAFLDLDDTAVLPGKAPRASGRAVDLAPEEEAARGRAVSKRGARTKRPAQLEFDGMSNAALEPAVQAIKRARRSRAAAEV